MQLVEDAQRAQPSLHDAAIDGVSISHQISWRRVPRERLGHLPRRVLSISTMGRERYTIRHPAPNILADGLFGSDNDTKGNAAAQMEILNA